MFYKLIKILTKNKSYNIGFVLFRVLGNGEILAVFKKKTSKLRWNLKTPYQIADPFVIIDEKNIIRIFYEEKSFNAPGVLKCVSIFDKNIIDDEKIDIGIDCHLSFPYVFKMENDYYMIPETSEIEEVSIYECVDFPLKWKKRKYY